MADKKVDATTGEVTVTKENQVKGEIEKECAERKVILKVHCKPVFNYQSVEFDVDIHEDTNDKELLFMEALYSDMLRMLIRVSEKAPQVNAKPVAPVEELASERQKQILRDFHIDFKPDITKKQAHALIKKSMDQDIY